MRSGLYVVALALALSALSAGFRPAVCAAQSSDDGPALFQYGFRGFWTGAELGLATGYLTTGSSYDKGEWRSLVLGLGIGAIIGVGTGVTLGMVDASDARRPRYGWYVLRDMGYGALLGAFTGAAVGALFWVDDGRPKDVLIGLSAGALIGAAVGIAFGIVEGSGAEPRGRGERRRSRALAERGVKLTLFASPGRRGVPALGPGLIGRF
ncbi:MAG TPA: hypothetical protein VK509_01245 [Polyangiales bacterium]|nr:hypothetical protein [Polyangiales bacterium]